jgi:hypothetical protein
LECVIHIINSCEHNKKEEGRREGRRKGRREGGKVKKKEENKGKKRKTRHTEEMDQGLSVFSSNFLLVNCITATLFQFRSFYLQHPSFVQGRSLI